MTARAFPARPGEHDAKDAGCAYLEISRIGFWGRRTCDLFVLGRSLEHRGVSGTARKIAQRLGWVAANTLPSPLLADEVLALEPGEWVEVKSAEEIRATLDFRGMRRGLYFMDEMWRFCGRRFRVFKRMERLMVERTGEMRAIHNTVLLEGTTCDGSAHQHCDATCQHLWRELWLRRVDGPGDDDGSV